MKTTTKYPNLSKHVLNGPRKQRVAQIEKQDHWTDDDLALLTRFCARFNLVNCEVELPFKVLVTLAFDARTPDNKAAELQQQVKERASRKDGL